MKNNIKLEIGKRFFITSFNIPYFFKFLSYFIPDEHVEIVDLKDDLVKFGQVHIVSDFRGIEKESISFKRWVKIEDFKKRITLIL